MGAASAAGVKDLPSSVAPARDIAAMRQQAQRQQDALRNSTDAVDRLSEQQKKLRDTVPR